MADGFDEFCRSLLAKLLWPGDISPALLADEFVRHFHLRGFPRFADIEAVVQDAGVGQVFQSKLPQGIRGFHVSLGRGPYAIHYREDDWEGGREHTVLHEVYEILMEKFHRECPLYVLPARQALCRRADRFAAEVLMQRETFSLFALASGLDVVTLQHAYRRSYASVAFRLVEVLPNTPFSVLIYRRREDGEPEEWGDDAVTGDFRAEAAVCSKEFHVWTRGVDNGLALGVTARKGDLPGQESVARQVVATGRAAFSETPDVFAIAKPVLWRHKLAKVVTVMVPRSSRGLMEPQLAGIEIQEFASVRREVAPLRRYP